MKNKKKFTFLTLALASLLVLSSCTKKPDTKSNESSVESSQTPSEIISDESSVEESIPASEEPVSEEESIIPSEEESVPPLESESAEESIVESEEESVVESEEESLVPSEAESEEESIIESEEEPIFPESLDGCGVAFMVDNKVIKTLVVQSGDFIPEEEVPADPTKEKDETSAKYRFVGWDRDLSEPITENTYIHAEFASYGYELMIDDFESYGSTGSMLDAGWRALGLNNTSGQWTEETKAAVSLGSNSVEGNRALRFDAWENGVGYKIAKFFQDGDYTQSANALKLRLMVPKLNVVKVLLHMKITIQEQTVAPSFTYTFQPTTNEYAEYVIPLKDDGWALWNEAGKSIASVAEWTGMHEDDITHYLTKLEVFIQGNDGKNGLPYIAFLDSARFVTLADKDLVFASSELLGCYERYTTTLESGNVARFDINQDKTATMRLIDLETPRDIPGKVVIDDDEGTFTFTADEEGLLTYVGRMTDGGKVINFIEASGDMRLTVDDMRLDAVQVVDNYEQYDEDGVAYYLDTFKSERSGCRGEYYGEFYSGDDDDHTDWGGSKWSLLDGDGDQLKLMQDPDGAHAGNNYLSLLNSREKGIRYMQWGLFDGSSEKNSFRGSKLGFWAKTSGEVKNFTAYMYSQTSPKNATKDNYVKSKNFIQVGSIDEWTHYEVDLNPDVAYFGFMIFTKENWNADSYLYIDDVEVYTANPYATYVAPPEIALPVGATYNAKIVDDLVSAKLHVDTTSAVTLTAPGLDTTVKGTYISNDYDLEITFTGGTKYSATMSEDYKVLECDSVEGGDSIAAALNNQDFTMIDYAENCEAYTENGEMYCLDNDTRSGLRGNFYCDAYTGGETTSPVGGKGWTLLSGGDQLELDKNDFVDGKQSIKMRTAKSGNTRYMQWSLYDGTGTEHTGYSKYTVYLKNPNDHAVKVRIQVYKVQVVATATQSADYRSENYVTIPANTDWAPYTVELNKSATYYGVSFVVDANYKADAWINMDLAYFGNLDPLLNYYGKENLTVSGEGISGAASWEFGEGNKIYFNYDSESLEDLEGTYKMVMNDGVQEMIITVDGATVRGTYIVDQTGMVTFTVLEVDGEMADYMTVGAVFTRNLG